MNSTSKHNLFYFFWILLTCLFLILAISFDGTGGNGDSVYHFLYAKYAWQDPSLFFNHWAKPLFTMVSSPFAQFGFVGIKVFNVLVSSLSLLFIYQIAKHFELRFAHLIFIPFYAAPLLFEVMFSGLTEPFSTFLLSAFILLWLNKHSAVAIILISFIPFVRSEGLIILSVVFAFLVWTKNWKYIPLLLLGHVIISFMGYAYYNDILWVFNKIPYAHLSSVYGIGNWTHFLNQMYFFLGPFIYVFLIVGLVKQLVLLFSKTTKPKFYYEKLFLVYGVFLAFFVAHTAFWALGIFNSMGLTRVFVTVISLVAIIAIEGLEWIVSTKFLKNYFIVPVLLLVFTIVFTLLPNPASINYKRDLNLDSGQLLIKNKIAPYLLKNYPNHIYMSGDLSLALFSERNVFNTNEFRLLYNGKPQEILDTNMVFIWDPWFARAEGNLDLSEIKQSKQLQLDTSFATLGKKSDTLTYLVFSKK